MKICVCGWYFHRPLLELVRDSRFEAFIVKNREGDTCGIPSALSTSVVETGVARGLDFGPYQDYLMHHWDGQSDVLFMQDDGMMTPQALEDIFDLSNNKDIDQAFIFRDEYEEFVNGGHHGRAFWMRANVMAKFKGAGGFEVDWDNTGNLVGRQANGMVHAFAKTMSVHTRCNWIAIVPGVHMGRRGWFADQPWQYKRSNEQQEFGMVTPPSNL